MAQSTEDELALARSEIARLKADNDVLRARVTSLEDRIASDPSLSRGPAGADLPAGDAILERLHRAIGTITDVAGALSSHAEPRPASADAEPNASGTGLSRRPVPVSVAAATASSTLTLETPGAHSRMADEEEPPVFEEDDQGARGAIADLMSPRGRTVSASSAGSESDGSGGGGGGGGESGSGSDSDSEGGDGEDDDDEEGGDGPVAASRVQVVEYCEEGITTVIDLRGEDRWAEGNEKRKLSEVPEAVYSCSGKVRSLLLGGNKIATVPSRLSELASSLTRLDLSDNGIVSLPAEIGQLSNLRTLELYKNKIKSLPDAIGDLSELRVLNCFNNSMMKLNPNVGRLTQLRELNVSSNRLITLPDLSALSRLKALSAFWNNLVMLPSLAGLPRLEELNLSDNKLESWPDLGDAPRLKEVNLGKNLITEIPGDAIEKLRAVVELAVGKNKLAAAGLPIEIARLPRLKKLLAPECGLTSFPECIAHSASLVTADVSDNAISSLPSASSEWRSALTLENFLASDNAIGSVPKIFADMRALTRFNVKGNPCAESDLPLLRTIETTCRANGGRVIT